MCCVDVQLGLLILIVNELNVICGMAKRSRTESRVETKNKNRKPEAELEG